MRGVRFSTQNFGKRAKNRFMIVLYTIDCGRCKALEMLLKRDGIGFEVVKDREAMKEKNITQSPVLEIDGVQYGFNEAVKWVRERGKK